MPISVLVGHLVGDYLLQNDWMAAGKKKSSFICAVHVALYTLAVLVLSGEWSPVIATGVAVPHFLIDRWGFIAWWMKFMRQPAFMEPPMSPWSRIVVDNVWHIMCLHCLFLATA